MSGQECYYQNHKEERKVYQKQYRLDHKDNKVPLKKSQNLTDLPLPPPKHHIEVEIEESLIEDIKEYSKLFPAHPKPMAEMVLDWAEDVYGYKHNIEGGTEWAGGLIKQALNGIKGEKRIESSFVLYGERANELSIPLSEIRLENMALK